MERNHLSMHKRKTRSFTKIILYLSVAACVAVMILSAAAASQLYRSNGDSFTSGLGRNLALLCSNSDYGLSRTQLAMIENAEIKNVRYETDRDGSKLFFARMIIHVPQANSDRYVDSPDSYLNETLEKTYTGGGFEECDIIGICRDNIPVVDVETLDRIVQSAEKAWENESLTGDANFEYALTDILIPEPFPDRVYSEGGEYQAVYSQWLDQCASQFAREGMTVTVNSAQSSDPSDIRAAMEQSITPFLCSVRNLTLARSESKKGYLTLSFDSLDVITTLHTAKKPSISALNKLCGVYSDERSLHLSIDIDLNEVVAGNGRMKLPLFNVVRAITSKERQDQNSRFVSDNRRSAERTVADRIQTREGRWQCDRRRDEDR